MLRNRIIPCLLIENGRLVKTRQFKDPKYVGDPINAVKIFNEKLADEILVVDISATLQGKEPEFDLIRKFAGEARMPVCYGGGIKSVSQVSEIISLGIEKVAICSAAAENIDLVHHSSSEVGSQSIVAIMEVTRKNPDKVEITYRRKNKTIARSPLDYARELEAAGAGELLVYSTERDGMKSGLDKDLLKEIVDVLEIPVTGMGGVGSHEDILIGCRDIGLHGVAAGAFFVFQGKYDAVLISYPDELTKQKLCSY